MIKDGKEHVCNGCFAIIAPQEPEAYQRGTFYYHSEAHEDMHVARNWDAYVKVGLRSVAGQSAEIRVA